VAFYDNGEFIGNGFRSGNTWSLNNVTFDVGSHSIVARYLGNAQFGPSESTAWTFTVAGYPTSVALTSNNNPSAVGQAVTFRAQISESSPGTPTGVVSFRANGQEIGTGTLSGNPAVATLTVDDLPAGTHPITAVYLGAGNFDGSTSGTLSQQVRRATSTLVTTTPNPSNAGAGVAFVATVSRTEGTTGTPQGSVTFYVDGNAIGTRTLGASSSGSATATLSGYDDMSGGPHVITASFLGNATFAASTSPDHSHTVSRTATSISWTFGGSLGTGPNPSDVGETVRLTARVTVGGSGLNTGTVTFYDNGVPIGTDTSLGSGGSQSGTASINYSFSTGGVHVVTAVYNANATYETSTTPAHNQTVIAPPVLTSISPTQVAGPNSGTRTFTFTVNGSGFQPGMTVSFSNTLFCNNGVTAGATTVNGAGTQATMTITVTSSASTSTFCNRTVTVTNPGGLSDSLSAVFRVT
jgi:hypothetical protein